MSNELRAAAESACEFAEAIPDYTALTTPCCLAECWMHFQRLARAWREAHPAGLIVRAVNAHADLLAALVAAEGMLLVAMRHDLPGWTDEARAEIIDGHPGIVQIRAAIAKARGN